MPNPHWLGTLLGVLFFAALAVCAGAALYTIALTFRFLRPIL